MNIQTNKVKLLLLIAVLILSACSSHSSDTVGQNENKNCDVGLICELTGVIEIEWAGYGREVPISTLKTNGACYLLALPKSIYSNNSKWDNQKVRIIGTAHSGVVSIDTTSFMLNERWVSVGVCNSEIAIYVEEIYKI